MIHNENFSSKAYAINGQQEIVVPELSKISKLKRKTVSTIKGTQPEKLKIYVIKKKRVLEKKSGDALIGGIFSETGEAILDQQVHQQASSQIDTETFVAVPDQQAHDQVESGSSADVQEVIIEEAAMVESPVDNKAIKISVMRKSEITDCNKLIRLKQLLEMLGVSRSTVYDWMNEKGPRFLPGFPRRIHLSKRAIAFRYQDVLDWLDSRSAKEVNSQQPVS